ncbi:MAG: hypothetical protein GY854_31115 [Deltaproteobacteria bacterium]|nr:hypothetical protein [Deltaproteobacteria bacterium]
MRKSVRMLLYATILGAGVLIGGAGVWYLGGSNTFLNAAKVCDQALTACKVKKEKAYSAAKSCGKRLTVCLEQPSKCK